MRVGIYARFSTDRQDPRSIEDQARLCRDYAERQRWTVLEVYADHAVSGASIHGRPAFSRVVADARSGALDVILAEDLDRISRSQADCAWLYERVVFAGVQIWTVADGLVTEMHVGLKGTMSALFLKNLALKTHRGMQGRVREGRIPGGRCYGYDVTSVGERAINAVEEAVVRRVFDEYVAGRSPREIAAGLNRDGIPGPRGGAWNASTIHGSRERGTGILRNDLYVGRLVWNRQRFLKDPDTGKRVSRPNAKAARMVVDLPDLRIIDEDTWQAAQRRLQETGGAHGPHTRTPRHLLSGLLRCGACGGSYIVAGPRQIACSTRRERGTCDNRRMVSIRLVEDRILLALENHLLDEVVVAEVVREYVAERKRLRRSAETAERRRAQRQGEIARAIKRLLDMAERGEGGREVGRRILELEAEQDALAREAAAEAPDVVTFHPAIAERYRAIVHDLRAELASRQLEDRREVFESVRALIERVVIYPRDDAGGRDMELHGKITALLGDAEKSRNSMQALVAGTGFEPVTFRL